MRAAPRSKAAVKKDLVDTARRHVKGAVTSADLFDPTDTGASLTSHAQIKEWAEAGRLAALALSKAAKVNSERDELELVEKRFQAMSEEARNAASPPAAILADFAAWKLDQGYTAWPLFELKQRPISAEASEIKAKEKLVEAAADCTARAQSRAVDARNLNRGGPNRALGTVVAGLADSRGAWAGTSGQNETLHPVMAELLGYVNPAEEWTPRACGEVHAMNQYLNDREIKSIKDIPRGGLYMHAETWAANKDKSSDRTGHWQSRGACANCKQWLDLIGALLV